MKFLIFIGLEFLIMIASIIYGIIKQEKANEEIRKSNEKLKELLENDDALYKHFTEIIEQAKNAK